MVRWRRKKKKEISTDFIYYFSPERKRERERKYVAMFREFTSKRYIDDRKR